MVVCNRIPTTIILRRGYALLRIRSGLVTAAHKHTAVTPTSHFRTCNGRHRRPRMGARPNVPGVPLKRATCGPGVATHPKNPVDTAKWKQQGPLARSPKAQNGSQFSGPKCTSKVITGQLANYQWDPTKLAPCFRRQPTVVQQLSTSKRVILLQSSSWEAWRGLHWIVQNVLCRCAMLWLC